MKILFVLRGALAILVTDWNPIAKAHLAGALMP